MTDPRTAEIALALLALTSIGAAAAAEASSAAQTYAEQCAFCHGAKGGGDGAASSMLTPRPTRFVDAAYWKSADRKKLAGTIAAGKPGTAMVPFASKLSSAQIEGLVAYLESFSN